MAFETILINLAFSLALSAVSYLVAPRPKTNPPAAASQSEFSTPQNRGGESLFVVCGEVLVPDPKIAAQGLFFAEALKGSGGKK